MARKRSEKWRAEKFVGGPIKAGSKTWFYVEHTKLTVVEEGQAVISVPYRKLIPALRAAKVRRLP